MQIKFFTVKAAAAREFHPSKQEALRDVLRPSATRLSRSKWKQICETFLEKSYE